MYILVLNSRLKQSQSGKEYFECKAKAEDGIVKANFWNATKDAHPERGEILKLTDFRDQRDTAYSNLAVNSYEVIERNQVPKETLSILYATKKTSDKDLKAAFDTIKNENLYHDKNNFILTMKCLTAVPIEKLMSCPAARSIHHAFQGGLIVHTAEVLRLCRGIVASFPFQDLINPDLVYAGATLHDIGKVFVYELDDIGEIVANTQETSVGHIYLGTNLVQTTAEKISKDGFPINKPFLNELLHIIASHHGPTEYGSIKPPSTLEALIVSEADGLDYRAAVVNEKINDAIDNKRELEDEWFHSGNRYITTSTLRTKIEE